MKELRTKPTMNNQKYKSKRCNDFFDTLYCHFGKRCLFYHDERSCNEVIGYSYYQKLLIKDEEIE